MAAPASGRLPATLHGCGQYLRGRVPGVQEQMPQLLRVLLRLSRVYRDGGGAPARHHHLGVQIVRDRSAHEAKPASPQRSRLRAGVPEGHRGRRWNDDGLYVEAKNEFSPRPKTVCCRLL